MATRTRLTGFNPTKIKQQMKDAAIAEQSRRLVEYAKATVMEIGQKIQSFDRGHHMDDSGNLLDSLCWGVCYSGELVESGFFREKRATNTSVMHGLSEVAVLEGNTRSKWKNLYNENVQTAMNLQRANWSYVNAGEEVDGHQRAADYIEKAGAKCKTGQWKVFFAILAPYWGYWEEGHQNILTQKFEHFAVMTQIYDRVKKDLKPASTRIHVHVDNYRSKSLYSQAKKNLRKRKKEMEL